MPELPEVETIRRSLLPGLMGRRIEALQVRNRRLRTPLQPARLRRELLGRYIAGIERRAKYLLLRLSDEQILVLHLGMSGRLSLVTPDVPLEPHTHVRLRLDGGRELRFRDHRRFGMLFVVAAADLPRHPRFCSLGPEPLEEAFTPALLQARARGLRRPVKNFIMDARVVVGVGNIYASEALHRAQVHPETEAQRLRLLRWERLHGAIRETLLRALRAGGTTLSDYRAADGRAGEFQVELAVYDREGQPCPRCARRIRRIVQAGRSTYFCPRCQR